ncbi:MAG: hypothetical protein J5703_05170 [Methanomicrobium sp.]|nr:hypothetical protein [Methanomicrobium sp.]
MSDAPQTGGEVPHPKGDVPHPPAPCRNACRSDLPNLLTHLTDTART